MRASNPNSSSNLTYEDAQNRSGYSDSPGSQRWYSEHLGHTQPFTPPDQIRSPVRLLCGVKGHPGDLPGQTKTWSGTWSVWKSKAFMLPSPCFLQLGGFGHILGVSLSHLPCASGLPCDTLTRAALPQSNTTYLPEILQGLPGSW